MTRIRIRGRELTAVRDEAVRDVPHRVSRIRPFRDQAREGDSTYIFSLPPAGPDKRYFGRDVESAPSRQMQIFFGRGEEDEQAEPVEPKLEGGEGDYYLQNTYDAVHVYRRAGDEGEEQVTPVANNGSAPLNDLPARLAAQNRDNARFWERQMAGVPHAAEPNAKALAAAISRVVCDSGTTDSAMLMQRANKAMNELHRQHYGSGRHDTSDAPRPKGFATPSQINRANRAKYTGRQ